MSTYQNLNYYLPEFYSYLKSRNLSPKTLTNYKSDMSHFLKWTNQSDLLNKSLIDHYLKHQTEVDTPIKTINRRLTTLRRLSAYLLETNVIKKDFMKGVTNLKDHKGAQNKILTNFEKYLKRQDSTLNTLKNYRSDIKAYTDWLNKNAFAVKDTSKNILTAYFDEITLAASKSTIKRKKSSLNKFFHWLCKTNIIEKPKIVQERQPKTHSFKFLVPAGAFFLFIVALTTTPSHNSQYTPTLSGINQHSLPKTTKRLTESSSQITKINHLSIQIDPDLPDIPINDKYTILKLTTATDKGELGSYNNLVYEQPSGKATIPMGNNQVLINNNQISKNSLIFITPTSSTKGSMLFIKEQKSGLFSVELDEPAKNNITFNWWAIDE